jgi:hypothetical protein
VDGQSTLWPNRLRARGERERESVCVCVCSKDHNRWFFVGSFRKVAKYSNPSDGRILLFWRNFGFRSDGVEGGLNSHGMKEVYVRPSVHLSFFLSVCLFVRPSVLPSIRPSFHHEPPHHPLPHFSFHLYIYGAIGNYLGT